MPAVEGRHDGFRIMNEVMARFAAAGLGSVTQSAMGSRETRPTKSGVSLADGIPARDGLRNDSFANHREYQ